MNKEKEKSNYFQYIKDRAVTGAVWFMLSTGAVFLYNRGLTIWNMPDTVAKLKLEHVSDSTEHHMDEIENRHYKHYQDSINKYHINWIGSLYWSVDSLRKEIKTLKRK